MTLEINARLIVPRRRRNGLLKGYGVGSQRHKKRPPSLSVKNTDKDRGVLLAAEIPSAGGQRKLEENVRRVSLKFALQFSLPPHPFAKQGLFIVS